MIWFIVAGVDKQSKVLHVVCVDSDTYKVCIDYGWIPESSLVQFLRSAGPNGKPLNFSVGNNSTIVQDCGSFTRFSPRGSAIVLAEMQDKRHKTTGYLLLSCANNATAELSVAEIVQREAVMPDGEHFLQNGIVRGNAVSCYPNKPFNVIVDKQSDSRPVFPKPKQVATPVSQASGGTKAGATAGTPTGNGVAKKNTISADKKDALVDVILSGKGPSAKSSDRSRLRAVWTAILQKFPSILQERNIHRLDEELPADVEEQVKNAFIWLLSSNDNDLIYLCLNEYRETLEQSWPIMIPILYSEDFKQLDDWFDKNQRYVLNAVDELND